MQKTEFSNPKFYSMMAFDDLTEWLNTGGYEKKNLILQAFSICDKKKLQLYIDDYLIFLSKLVQEDLFKAYECTKYIWVQTSAIATQKGLNDWTIYIINHKYYQALNNVKTTNEIFEICRHFCCKT